MKKTETHEVPVDFRERVEQLCATAELDVPEIRIAPVKPIGQFSAFVSRRGGAFILTADPSVLLLLPEERDGLLAHELGHIADERLQTRYPNAQAMSSPAKVSFVVGVAAGLGAVVSSAPPVPAPDVLASVLYLMCVATILPPMRQMMRSSQEREYFADEFGARLLGSVEHCQALHRRREAIEGKRKTRWASSRFVAWLATHPTDSDRERRLHELKLN